jgi:hypothetical protein
MMPFMLFAPLLLVFEYVKLADQVIDHYDNDIDNTFCYKSSAIEKQEQPHAAVVYQYRTYAHSEEPDKRQPRGPLLKHKHTVCEVREQHGEKECYRVRDHIVYDKRKSQVQRGVHRYRQCSAYDIRYRFSVLLQHHAYTVNHDRAGCIL